MVFRWLKLLTSLTLAAAHVLTPVSISYSQQCDEGCALQRTFIPYYGQPPIDTLPLNLGAFRSNWYQQVTEPALVFSAPGGQIMRAFGQGLHTVTSMNRDSDWTQINADEWVLTSKLRNIDISTVTFRGAVLMSDNLEEPMGWLLFDLYPRGSAGGPHVGHPRMARYTPVNIYNTVSLDGVRWHLIGRDKWVNEYQIAELHLINQPADISTELWIAVDLTEQVMVVYEGQQAIFATLAATGIETAPTREGIYPITFRRETWSMTGLQTSSETYSLEDVPFAMFFDEGRAFHAVYWHNNFGYPSSEGCITLSLTDARWLYERVADYMGSPFTVNAHEAGGPMVFIYSS